MPQFNTAYGNNPYGANMRATGTPSIPGTPAQGQYFAGPAFPGQAAWGPRPTTPQMPQGAPNIGGDPLPAAFNQPQAQQQPSPRPDIYAQPQQQQPPTNYNPYFNYNAGQGAQGLPPSPITYDTSQMQNQLTTFPNIAQTLPLSPTINPLQERQLINQAVSANEADYGRAILDAREGLGNRGWSPNSPAISDFIGRADLNRAMANTQARTNIPIDIAKMNRENLIAQLQANTGAAGVNVGAYSAQNRARTDYLDALMRLLG